jgi:hypothetical protein
VQPVRKQRPEISLLAGRYKTMERMMLNKTVSFRAESTARNLAAIRLLFSSLFALWCICAPTSLANSPAFDLVGPGIKATVTRDGKTLPLSQVSDLQAGDKLWIQPDFPDDQSARYLLIVAFLQGPTNPPPGPGSLAPRLGTKRPARKVRP